MTKFSIVIPTYNRGKMIAKTIKSVLAQRYTDFEVLIVDDGSTDNTEEVIKSFTDERIRYIKKKNEERAAARNTGTLNAIGDYITFLDSDDTISANHLLTACEFIKQNGLVEIFHLGYEIRNENGALIKAVDRVRDINSNILSGNMLSCMGVFIRKDIAKQNLFNADRELSSLEDWELWIRMSARYTFLNSNLVTSTLVQHSQRSVVSDTTENIKLKVKKFIYYVECDTTNRSYYGSKLSRAKASALTYCALHMAMARGKKTETLRYLLMGIGCNPREIFKRRFLAIFKILFLD